MGDKGCWHTWLGPGWLGSVMRSANCSGFKIGLGKRQTLSKLAVAFVGKYKSFTDEIEFLQGAQRGVGRRLFFERHARLEFVGTAGRIDRPGNRPPHYRPGEGMR